jgi:hypothetical protein
MSTPDPQARTVSLRLTLEQLAYVHTLVAAAADDIHENGALSPYAGFLADDEAAFDANGDVTPAARAAIVSALRAMVRAMETAR